MEIENRNSDLKKLFNDQISTSAEFGSNFNIIEEKNVINKYKDLFFCSISQQFSIVIAFTQTRIDVFNSYHNDLNLLQSFDYYYWIESIHPISSGEVSEMLIVLKNKMIQIISYNVSQHFFRNLLMMNCQAIPINPFAIGSVKSDSTDIRFNES